MSASLEARPRAGGPRLSIRGAAVHNLQQIDVDIPLGQMTVLSGLSGSGKSSLAVDLIVAEGQRQYLESLSVFARQFFHQRRRPDVRSISGLQPTVCIDQRVGSLNPRSTVGTLTDLHDFLRVLYARMGVPHCPHCARPIRPQSVERIVEQLLELPERTRLLVLAPLVRGRPGTHREVFESIRRQRLVRVRIDGEVHDVDALPELNARRPHTIEAVVDRIVIHGEVAGRLGESVRLAVELSGGSIAASCMRLRATL